ncbi:MAG: sigma-70 family RNA polymerase sigma factor [Planctomycetota bacterium]|nr:MAG: sigma-70 family RNA polymerase sigma factor [Planctomycetota bacterium]
MSSGETRPSLLLRLRDPADSAAWAEFDRTYRDLILGYCRRRGLQWGDAEDVRQKVMLNLAKATQRSFAYRPERGRFRNYLARAVQNAIHQHFSRPNRGTERLATEMSSILADPKEDQNDLLWEQEWIRHHFRLAMAKVKVHFDLRSVQIFEALLDGSTTEAVAHEFGLTTQAVHKVKQRIRKRMEAWIARQVEAEDRP